MSAQNLQAYYDQWRLKPVGQGLIEAISYGEGTPGEEGYRTMFGGGRFNSFARHPDQVVRSGGYASAAAGKGQFMPFTWDGIVRSLGEKDFSPAAQDRGILYLADKRLKPIGGLSALEKEGFSPRVSGLLAPEWASLPTASGKSYYGQPVKKLEELQKRFSIGAQGGGSPMAPPGGASSATAPTGNDMESALLRQIMGGSGDNALGGLGLGSLKVPGLEDIGGTLPGLKLAGAAAPLVAAMSIMDPEAGRMAGAQLQQAIADQQIMQAHGGLAKALMPEVPSVPGAGDRQGLDAMAGMGQLSAQSPSQAQGDSPGIRRTAYGDNVQFETPDGARYRLIHGTKDLKTGTYVQGGWGPQGANQYGDHFDIARVDGGFFDRSALDKFALVNGKPLSAGLTVKGGEFGASRDGGARVHKAWDYAFGKGARLQLANGARWLL